VSADLSGEITAIATTVLAAFAFITAILAAAAFWKQRQEVRTIEQQVNDQREINALQAEDLQESLKERARLRQLAERQQADKVSLRMTYVPFPDYSEETYLALMWPPANRFTWPWSPTSHVGQSGTWCVNMGTLVSW
jgi:hypothetical protein